MLGHAAEEGDGAAHIDTVVFERDLAGLAHGLGAADVRHGRVCDGGGECVNIP